MAIRVKMTLVDPSGKTMETQWFRAHTRTHAVGLIWDGLPGWRLEAGVYSRAISNDRPGWYTPGAPRWGRPGAARQEARVYVDGVALTTDQLVDAVRAAKRRYAARTKALRSTLARIDEVP